jgi:hypothetical protein
LIRGTILSDVMVEGEYRTLDLYRPGNVIEVEDFDGTWASITITTRPGNRDGDNVHAHMLLRDVDLRAVGIDCERILSGAGILIAPLEPAAPLHAFVERSTHDIDEPATVPAPTGNGAHERNDRPDITVDDPVVTTAAPAAGEPGTGDNARYDDFTVTIGRTTIEGKLIVEIGGAIVSLAIPVLLYLLGRFLRKPPPRR